MSTVSRRYGAPRLPIAHDSLPADLRHDLWLAMLPRIAPALAIGLLPFEPGPKSPHDDFAREVWLGLLRMKPDPSQRHVSLVYLQHWFYEDSPWSQALDLVELVGSWDPARVDRASHFLISLRGVASALDTVFAAHLSPWRFTDEGLTAVGDGEKVVAAALEVAAPGAQHHLTLALRNLAARPTPNVPGAIAEALNAVESTAKLVTGKASASFTDGPLQFALGEMGVHPQFSAAFKSFHIYASDSGIRHGAKPGKQPTDDLAEAQMFVAVASAFVLYLQTTNRRRPEAP